MNLFAPEIDRPFNVRGTELSAGDTRDQYRQKLARITLDSMVQFVGLLDARGTVLEINQVALDAVGIQLSDVEGKPFWTTFWWQVSEEIRATLRESIVRAARGEFVRWDTEIYGRAGGKETIIIDASLYPVKDAQGDVVFITAEGRDITEKKAHEREIARQREELAKLDELKTQFFANISHEFRTPLTLMMGPLEDALAGAEPLTAANRERLELAHRNSMRLLKLVNTLLDFSRIEAGRIEASYEPTDLCLLTTELASIFRSAIERAGMRLIVHCRPLAGMVYVDREMWEKIVLNLLSNAFKFTFTGEIEVSLCAANSKVEMTVRDTGIGIPADEIPKLFERFHRVKGARGRSYEGSGIGLALVQELVKLHGGSMHVESEVNGGSRFTVSLPLGKAHLPAERIQAPRSSRLPALAAEAYVDEAERWSPGESGATAPGRIPTNLLHFPAAPEDTVSTPRKELIILADDNADMRDYLTHLLQGEYRVHAVRDGLQAAEAIRRLRPALVLTDVMMPGLDGFGVLRALRGDPSLSSTPLILLSARAGEESRIEGLQAGADDYLVKPFTARELMARVATHVKMGNLRREAAEREARLRAEAELERHRLHDLLAQAPAGIGLMNGPEYRWTYVNDHYVHLTGRSSSADFIGKTLRESLPEVEAQSFGELLYQAYRTGEPCVGREMKARLNRAATGQPDEAYFDFVYQPVRNTEGKVEGILVHAVEVTDKVTARRTIEENAERLYLAQTAAHIGTWEWDPVQDTRTLSPELHRIFGTDGSGPDYAQEWASRVYAADWPKVQRLMEDGHRSGSMEFEYRYEHPELGLRWFYCKGRRLQGETRMVGMVQDITSRKSAEEVSQRLAAIVDSAADAILSKDLNGTIESWNEGACRMFGYTADEIIGQPILRLVPPELHGEQKEILRKLKSGKRIDHYETTRIKKNGEPVEVSVTISPIRDRSGQVTRASEIARDISDRKRIERLLIQSEKFAATGRMAAAIAHEINNPLESLMNLIFLARRDSAAQGKAHRYLLIAEGELERVSHIARQTLGYYRDTNSPAEVQIHSLIENVLTVYNAKLVAAGISVDARFNDPRKILVSKGEMLQVFSNIVANAIDAMRHGGTLSISMQTFSAAAGEGIQTVVRDSGTGIRKEHLAKIFEPFFTTKGDLGTGIGLWVAKQLVEGRGGEISVESSTEAGNSGTTVTIFVPFANPGT